MKRINFTLLFVVMLLFVTSCAQKPVEVDDTSALQSRREALYDVEDQEALCEKYEGLYFDIYYPKQLVIIPFIDLAGFTEQQNNEFDRLLRYGNDLDRVKYIAENHLSYGEGIQIDNYRTENDSCTILVTYHNDSTSIDDKNDFLYEEFEKVLYKSRGSDYMMIRSQDTINGRFIMRFVALGEKHESVEGELIYPISLEKEYKKLEPYIVKSVTFK